MIICNYSNAQLPHNNNKIKNFILIKAFNFQIIFILNYKC